MRTVMRTISLWLTVVPLAAVSAGNELISSFCVNVVHLTLFSGKKAHTKRILPKPTACGPQYDDPSVLRRRIGIHYPQRTTRVLTFRLACNGAAAHEKTSNDDIPAEVRGEDSPFSSPLDAWVDATNLSEAFLVSNCISQEERYVDTFVDVSAYSTTGTTADDTSRHGSDANDGGNVAKPAAALRPAFLRLRPEVRNGGDAMPAYYSEPNAFITAQSKQKNSSKRTMREMEHADLVAETTLRWCDDFVVHLGLCPWAKLSLTAQRAVRVKVVPQELGIHNFEQVIRDASEELLRVTGQAGQENAKEADKEDDEASTDADEFIDPNVAITFVVASPPIHKEAAGMYEEFDFVPFHEFASDLEDVFFAESLEYEKETADEPWLLADETPRIGDLITVAPFHPQWQFAAAAATDDDLDDDDSVAWEKRAPYPTISLVRTSAIMAAGHEATERIGMHNEKVLAGIGSHALRGMFEEKVLLSPVQPVSANDGKRDEQVK